MRGGVQFCSCGEAERGGKETKKKNPNRYGEMSAAAPPDHRCSLIKKLLPAFLRCGFAGVTAASAVRRSAPALNKEKLPKSS